MEAGGSSPGEGDKALAALLLVHGVVMNGGIDHALVALSTDEYNAGIEGFRYFGLTRSATVLEEARSAKEADIDRLNTEYGIAVPGDNKLVHAFHLKLAASPEAFSPLREPDV